MKYIIRCPDGSRWKVREAISLKAAINEIAMAKVSGSIGHSSTMDNTLCGGSFYTVASVHRINSDGTEAQAYQRPY